MLCKSLAKFNHWKFKSPFWKGSCLQELGSVHTGPKFWVPSPLKSIRAISAIQSVEVETYHLTWGPKS